MSKYTHNTLFLNKIFGSKTTKAVDKSLLNFKLSLILLNRPLDRNLFVPLYKYASNVILCDGASNRLYDSFTHDRDEYLPTHIVGDLDSSREDVIEYYSSKDVAVHKESDQNFSDAHKGIRLAAKLLESEPLPEGEKTSKVVILFPFGGRIDQTLN